MKKFLLTLLITLPLTLPSLAAVGDIFTVGNLKYKILDNSNNVNVAGIADEVTVTNLVILSVTNWGGQNYTVTSIGSGAFKNCASLESVEFPNTVTSIWNNAFQNCTSLTSVDTNKVTDIYDSAFSGCKNLQSVSLPEVQKINFNAFSGCSTLTSIEMPMVQTIYKSAFSNCTSLTSIELPESLTTIIDINAFSGCNSLSVISVNTGNTNYSSGNGFLLSKDGKEIILCPPGMISVTIPESVTIIGANSFEYCQKLTSLTIPEGVTEIGDNAFKGCWFASISLPTSISTIGDNVFASCEKLKSITCLALTPPSIFSNDYIKYTRRTPIYVKASAYEAYTAEGSGWSDYYIQKLVEVGSTFTSGDLIYTIKSMPDGDTPGTVSLTNHVNKESFSTSELIIPSTVKYAGLNFSVTKIDNSALSSCDNLNNVEIPSSVTELGSFVFDGCLHMILIKFKSEYPPIITENTFFNVKNEYQSTVVAIPSTTNYANNEENWDYLIQHNFAGLNVQAYEFEYEYENNYVLYEVISFQDKTCRTKPGSADGKINDVNGKLFLPSKPKNDSETFTLIEIGEYSFANNYNLGTVEVEIPNTVESIGDYAFFNYSHLTSFTCLSENPPALGNYVFYGTYASSDHLKGIKIYVPDVSNYNEFSDWKNDEKIGGPYYQILPITSGKETFEKDGLIYQIEDRESREVSLIGVSEESSLTHANTITIPEKAHNWGNDKDFSIISIGENAFSECYALKYITCLANDPIPTIEANLSLKDGRIPIKVPAKDYQSYKDESSWDDYNVMAIFDYDPENKFILTNGDGQDLLKYEITNLQEEPENDDFYGTVSIIGKTENENETLRFIPEILGSVGKDIELKDLLSHGEFRCGGYIFSVTAIGPSAFADCTDLTSITIPSSVTDIAPDAFNGCSSLTSITVDDWHSSYSCTDGMLIDNRGYTLIKCPEGKNETAMIPSHVTAIAPYAFANCSQLTEIEFEVDYEGSCSLSTIPSNAFENCISLEAITIPNSVRSIGDNAFANCRNISSVTIPNTVTIIGDNAFADCISLQSITCLAIERPTIGSNDFLQERGIPIYVPAITYEANKLAWIGYNIKAIFKHAPENKFILTNRAGIDILKYEITRLPEDFGDPEERYGEVTILGITGFDDDYPRAPRLIPEIHGLDDMAMDYFGINELLSHGEFRCGGYKFRVTAIGDRAFNNYSDLISVSIPSTVTSIGNDAFIGCGSLTSIDIPEGVITIGDEAFYGCAPISVTIPSSVTSIGEYAFYGCSNLTKVDFEGPSNLNAISDNTFQECTCLTSISLPSSVTTIGKEAFQNCGALPSIELPSDLTSIGASAFNNCYALTSVTIPASVSSIEKEAFVGCSNLTEVTCLNESPASLGNKVFNRTYDNSDVNPNLEIYVPGGTLNAYKTSDSWSDYRDNLRVKATGISLDITSKTLEVGEPFTLTATITPADATDAITWSSNDEDIATVVADADNKTNGNVTAISEGTTIITVTCGAFSATCNLTVTPKTVAITGISLIMDGSTLSDDETIELLFDKSMDLSLTASIAPSDATEKPTWTSSNPEIATVDADGNVTVIKHGEVTITASSPNNVVSKSCTLEIFPLGDATKDKEIDVTDVVATANHIVDNPVSVFFERAADINRNNSITVTDAWLIAEKASTWNLPTPTNMSNMPKRSNQPNNPTSAQLIATATPTSLQLSLSATGYTALQVDILLPDGVEVSKAILRDGATDAHTLMTAAKDNLYRLMIFSMGNDEFTTESPIVELQLQGNSTDDLQILNALASDTNANPVELDIQMSSSTSGILEVGENSEIEIKSVKGGIAVNGAQGKTIHIFTPDGKLLKTQKSLSNSEQIPLAPSLYIIRVSDRSAAVVVR